MAKFGLSALVLGLALSFSFVQADDKKLDNPEAGKCPVSKKDIDPKVTAEVGGKTYGFCCAKCCAKFKEHPEKFLEKK
jgi:YHS domain-containing protein